MEFRLHRIEQVKKKIKNKKIKKKINLKKNE